MQVQCPNCGGYKVGTVICKVHPTTHKEYPKVGYRVVGLILIGFFVMLFASFAGGKGGWFGAVGMFLVVLGLFIWVRGVPKGAINRYDNLCTLCGYKWNRLENESEPPVTIRPDLMQKGVEEIKKQQETAAKNAAAAAYLQQQRRNRK